jgi:hypothetical protein
VGEEVSTGIVRGVTPTDAPSNCIAAPDGVEVILKFPETDKGMISSIPEGINGSSSGGRDMVGRGSSVGRAVTISEGSATGGRVGNAVGSVVGSVVGSLVANPVGSKEGITVISSGISSGMTGGIVRVGVGVGVGVRFPSVRLRVGKTVRLSSIGNISSARPGHPNMKQRSRIRIGTVNFMDPYYTDITDMLVGRIKRESQTLLSIWNKYLPVKDKKADM